jgi:hypothetical protein
MEKVLGDIRRIGLLCWTVAVTPLAAAQPSPADWSRADAATVRVSPSAFTNLPSAIRTAMEKRGCTVPQPAGSERRRNVITGHFTGAKAREWAALCSRDRRSTVLVFHGDGSSKVDEVGEAADADYLQTRPGGRIGFSRALLVASPRAIKRIRTDDGPKLRVIDHDGIVDAFEGKGSMIWYWLEGKWVLLPGSD